MIVISPIDITQTFKVVTSLSLHLKCKSTPYVQVGRMHYLCFPAPHLSRKQSITPSLTMEISHCTFLLVSGLLHYSSPLTRFKPLPISPVQPFLPCRHITWPHSFLHPIWDLTLVSSGSLHLAHILSLCQREFLQNDPKFFSSFLLSQHQISPQSPYDKGFFLLMESYLLLTHIPICRHTELCHASP